MVFIRFKGNQRTKLSLQKGYRLGIRSEELKDFFLEMPEASTIDHVATASPAAAKDSPVRI
jgi:hypothetical protein